MSYCRWSSDDFSSDLYCYEDCSGGYTTHVASNRPVGDVPTTPPWPEPGEEITDEWAERTAAAHNAQHAFLMTAERRPIGLPYDGQSFNDPTLEAFLARLLVLRAAGYRFPDYALAVVRAEIAEAQAADPNKIVPFAPTSHEHHPLRPAADSASA